MEMVYLKGNCDGCGKSVVVESHNDPGKDLHGEHGIDLCVECGGHGE